MISVPFEFYLITKTWNIKLNKSINTRKPYLPGWVWPGLHMAWPPCLSGLIRHEVIIFLSWAYDIELVFTDETHYLIGGCMSANRRMSIASTNWLLLPIGCFLSRHSIGRELSYNNCLQFLVWMRPLKTFFSACLDWCHVEIMRSSYFLTWQNNFFVRFRSCYNHSFFSLWKLMLTCVLELHRFLIYLIWL